jgi:hypothetical protein
MAQETTARVFRQASDDAREMAMSVIHNPSLNTIKDHADNVFQTILELLRRIRDTVQAPNAFVEQLHIIFRDESEWCYIKKLLLKFNTF